MTLTIKGVHYDITERNREFITDKLGHIDPFKEHIVSADVTITKEKNDYKVDSNVHFRWGIDAHISESDETLYPAIDKLIDKLTVKIAKEKEKAKDHHKDKAQLTPLPEED
jgi:putative sigma-54 modulation protein